jgi:hypothetical protein
MKYLYYLGRIVQGAGLLLILDVLIVSALNNEGMAFLMKFTLLGMVIFMLGWALQKSTRVT